MMFIFDGEGGADSARAPAAAAAAPARPCGEPPGAVPGPARPGPAHSDWPLPRRQPQSPDRPAERRPRPPRPASRRREGRWAGRGARRAARPAAGGGRPSAPGARSRRWWPRLLSARPRACSWLRREPQPARQLCRVGGEGGSPEPVAACTVKTTSGRGGGGGGVRTRWRPTRGGWWPARGSFAHHPTRVETAIPACPAPLGLSPAAPALRGQVPLRPPHLRPLFLSPGSRKSNLVFMKNSVRVDREYVGWERIFKESSRTFLDECILRHNSKIV